MDVQHNPWFLALDAHKNAQVRIYNPVNFLKPWDMQARLHDKYLIIDDQMYTLGGRNTTNLFLGDYSKGKNIDKELFVYETDPGKNMQNTSMSQLQTYFDSIWDSSDSKPCRGSRNGKKDGRKKSEALKKSLQRATEKSILPHTKNQNWEELTFETNKITLLSNPIESEKQMNLWMWYSLHRLNDVRKIRRRSTPLTLYAAGKCTTIFLSSQIITSLSRSLQMMSQKAPIRGAVQIT